MYLTKYDKNWKPNPANILAVLENKKPEYLPLYEHHIEDPFISRTIGQELTPLGKSGKDLEDHYITVMNFWKEMTYDAWDYEAMICDVIPEHGAIFGTREGPIQTPEDFEKYPFDDIVKLWKERYVPQLEALRKTIPITGMMPFGGPGYGIFEGVQDFVGYENLCVMLYDEPELFANIFKKVGDLWYEIWEFFLKNYGDMFLFFRLGDDLAYKSSTMLSPDTIREHVFPQHRRFIDLVHKHNKKFLFHCCGNIVPLMDEIIDNGIDAKHSNENVIAPMDFWVEKYNDRIGLFGGIDMTVLINNKYDYLFDLFVEDGTRLRNKSKGFGFGCGHSIPIGVPTDSFAAIVEAAKCIRANEKK